MMMGVVGLVRDLSSSPWGASVVVSAALALLSLAALALEPSAPSRVIVTRGVTIVSVALSACWITTAVFVAVQRAELLREVFHPPARKILMPTVHLALETEATALAAGVTLVVVPILAIVVARRWSGGPIGILLGTAMLVATRARGPRRSRAAAGSV